MLPKKKRLNRTDFNRFFSAGKKTHTPPFLVIYSPHPTFHASVVVSKKVERTAVGRNKIRRRIYDMVRNQQKLTGETGVYIFVVKPEVKDYTVLGLREVVQKIITK